MEGLHLQESVVFLAAAGLVIPFVKRFDVSPVLGFLVVGLAVGPYGLSRFVDEFEWLRYVLITNVDGVTALAELGVVFLLFMIGLELSLERLWAMRRLVFGLGTLQIVVSGAAIGAIAAAFGNSTAAALILGASLALSSTAVVMQLLTEQGRFGSVVGRTAFAVLLAQDIAIVPILFIIEALGAKTDGGLLLALGMALGKALLTVVVILGAGRKLLRPVFHFVSGARSPELFMAATLLIIVVTASLTHAVGLSAALGAFLAGLLFAETEFRHEIEVDIEPFKGLLLGLFFMSVGMSIDLAEIVAEPFWVPLSIVGLFLVKAVIIGIVTLPFGLTFAQRVEMGLLLGQGGEFAFVAIGLALTFGLVPAHTAQFMLIVVAATMFLSPWMSRVARQLGERLAHNDDSSEPAIEVPTDLRDHIVLAGFGRTGQLLAQVLDRQQIPHVALDLDGRLVGSHRSRGTPVYLGDASRAELLNKLALTEAAALVVTTDDAAAAERVVKAARRQAPELAILARARDAEHAYRLLEVGATQVIPEVLEAGLDLGRLTLVHAGFPDESARELVDLMRAEIEPDFSR